MKIAFFDIEEWEKDIYKKKLSGQELYFDTHSLTTDNLEKVTDAVIISASTQSSFNKEVLDKIPTLKLYITSSTGFDHIDLGYCTQRNIVACNIPDYGSITVAEHTFALILALSRKLILSSEAALSGKIDYKMLCGMDLYGKTLGIVGVGSIGREVIRIAKGFGMNVVAYTRNPSESDAKRFGIQFVSLDELLSNADVISLHVPYNKSTHHLINTENIQKFKKGSIFINTARGGVVQTEAIVKGLNQEILLGVGLDVLENSDNWTKTDDALIQLAKENKNVIVTPHNAFNSTEALIRIVDITIKNIQAFIENRPINVVG